MYKHFFDKFSLILVWKNEHPNSLCCGNPDYLIIFLHELYETAGFHISCTHLVFTLSQNIKYQL